MSVIDSLARLIRASGGAFNRASPFLEGSAATFGLGALGAGALSAGIAAAQAAPDSETELDRIEARIAEARRNAHRFESIDRNDPEAVINMQGFLQSQGLYNQGYHPDGIWAGGTNAAIETYLARNAQQLDDDLQARSRLQADAVQRPQPWRQYVREAGAVVPLFAGLALAAGGRRMGVRATNALVTHDALPAMTSKAARAEPLRRMANVNEFWRRGGAGANVPFRETKSARGFAERRGAPEASSLFPIHRRYGGVEIGSAAGGLAEAGGMELWLHNIRQDLDDAEAASAADPGSQAKRDEVDRLRDLESIVLGAQRLGLGIALGSALAPLKMAPNIAAGQADRAVLNQYLATPLVKR